MEITKGAKNGVAFKFTIPLIDSGSRPDYKASPTLAAGDVKVVRYTASAWSVANITSLPSPITGATTLLEVSLTATEMTADDDTRAITVLFIDAAGGEWDDQTVVIRLGKFESNVTEINGATTPVGNLEDDYDGTGYNKSSSTIGTASALTGHTPQTGDSYPRIGAPTGASIAADIVTAQSDLDLLTGTDGATLATAQANYAPSKAGDAMDLVTDAVDANAVATTGANEIRDAILSDSTPFAGANIDAAISSRSDFDETTDPVELLDTGGTAGTSASELVDDVWDEAIAGHVGVGSFGEEIQSHATPAEILTIPANTLDTDAAGRVDVSLIEGVDATNQIRDAILSDSTPFAGASIDAAISTRATPTQVATELSNIRLDELMDSTLVSQPTAGSLFGDLTEDDAGTQRFTTNALEQAPSGTGLTPLASGTAQGGSASTIQLAAAHTFLDDELNGTVVNIVSGTGAGQSRVIKDYTGASDTATITPDWTTNPSTDSVYEVVQGSVNLSAIQNDDQSTTDLKDFVDAGYDPATNKVQGVVLVDTVTTLTGHTPQTGDSYIRLGAPAGASVSADIAAVKTDTGNIETDTQDLQTQIGTAGAGLTDLGGMSVGMQAEVNTEVDTALTDINLDHLMAVAATGTEVVDNSAIAQIVSKAATADWDTFDNTTDSLEAIADGAATGDWTGTEKENIRHALGVDGTKTAPIGGYGRIGNPTGADLATDIAGVQSTADAIETDTQDLQTQIGTAGAGLTDLGGMSTGMKAEVNLETDTALSDINLDHLLAVAVVGTDVINDSVIAQMVSKSATADWDTFDNTADSLEAIRDRGDAAWLTGGGTGLSSLATGTAQSGAVGYIQLAAGESAVTDFYKSTRVLITGGLGVGQARFITDYNGTSKQADVSPNWRTAPDNTSTYEVQAADSNMEGIGQESVVGNRATLALKRLDLQNDGAPAFYIKRTSSGPAIEWESEGDVVHWSCTTSGGNVFVGTAGSSAGDGFQIVIPNDSGIAIKAQGGVVSGIGFQATGGSKDIDATIDASDFANAFPAGVYANHPSVSIGAGGIAAASFASGAVDANALATDAVNEIRDSILSDSTPFAGANIDAALSDIEADTQDLQTQIGTAGAGLTDLGGMSTGMKAEVNTEADTALSDINLDHLMAVAVVGTDVVDDSVIAQLVSKSATADWDTFDNTTDSLEAIRDNQAAGTGDWTGTEKENIRHSLGVDGTKTAPTGGYGRIGDPAGADLATDIAAVKTVVDSNATDLGTITGSDGATLATSQPNYAPAKAGDDMNLADDAITSVKYDETSAWPVTAADTGATRLGRTGADSDTLETLSDQMDGLQTSVDGIQNNTRFVATVPQHLLIPDAGTTMYKLSVNFYDTNGDMEDPDSNEIDVLYEDVAGVDKDAFFDDASGTTPATPGVIDANMWKMVRISTGVYETYYKLPNTETPAQWTATFKLNEASTLLQYARSSNVVDENPGSVTLADNAANKQVVAEGVLATPANKLDTDASGRVDIGSWAGTAVGAGASSGLPAVDAQAISDSTAAADNVEANIGNLDAAISSRASASALSTHDGKLDTVDGIVDDILIDTADMQPKLGTPVALDGGSATLGSMLTKIADDNGGLDYDATTDSLHEAALSEGDWVAGEKEQIRSALGIDGTKTAAVGGQLQSIQADVNGIETDLADGTYGLSALRTAIDSNATDIAAVQADTDDIQTKIGAPADIDGGGATLADNLKKLADDNGGTTFDATTDSQQSIRAAMLNLTSNELAQWKNALGMDDSGTVPVGGDLQDVEALATAIKAVTDLIPDAGAMTSIAQEATLGTPVGADLSADIATVLTAVTGVRTEIDDATYGLAALKALIDGVPVAVLAETVDGSADVQIALTKILAYCAGNIARVGTVYTYRNYDDTADEMTHTATSTTRTRS